MNQSIQRKVNTVDKQAILSFKTSTDLHNSIKKLKDKKPSSSTSAHNFHVSHKASDYIKEAKIERLNAENMQSKFTIESEVVSLPNRLVVESLPRTQELLKKQRESRRERHIKAMNEYEKVQEFLAKKIADDYDAIKKEISDFFKASDKGNFFGS
jgi:golgin subfamily A member 4